MSAAITNPYKITWGTFEVGGTTEKLLPGYPQESDDHDVKTLTFEVLVRGTSDATFAANCAEIESEFSKRRQRIFFQLGTETVFDFNPTGNTGLNTWARCEKAGTPGADTDRSRLYRVTLGCEKPSTDTSGRRDLAYTVTYLPTQQRVVVFRGVYTALTSNGAFAQFNSVAPAYMSSVLSGLTPSATFEMIGKEVNPDDQDDTARVTVTWKEILQNQPGGSPDNATIVDPMLTWSRTIEQPGDSGRGKVRRLQLIALHFECSVDKTASTDLAGLYSGTIRPYIRTQLTSTFSPSAFAWLNETYALNYFTNTLSVDVVFQVVIGAAGVVRAEVTSKIVEDDGRALTGVWNKTLFSKYVDQGIVTRLRFTIRTLVYLGVREPAKRIGSSGGGSDNSLGDKDAGEDGKTEGWVRKGSESAATTITLGQPGSDQITLTTVVEQIVHEWIVKPDEGAAGGGPVVTEPDTPGNPDDRRAAGPVITPGTGPGS